MVEPLLWLKLKLVEWINGRSAAFDAARRGSNPLST